MNPLDDTDRQKNSEPDENPYDYDFSYVRTKARIAIYDDLRSAPRIVEVQPAETSAFIENLTLEISEQSRKMGGIIPFTIIHEVTENFIHAKFREIVVSILDRGNTIRFSDQGPGIHDKEKVQLPGFSSAIEPMTQYIRGVGSGLPIVKEYLTISNGKITIEDNLNTGSVVTISLMPQAAQQPPAAPAPYGIPPQGYPAPQAPAQPAYSAPPQSYPPQDATRITYSYASYPGSAQAAQPPSPDQYPYRDELVSQALSSLQPLVSSLTERDRTLLQLIGSEGPIGVTDLSRLSEIPASTVHASLNKLEQSGLVKRHPLQNKQRILSDLGIQANLLLH
ncbi:MAG: ATP-binding protein [Eggerthellaceae bacterium]|nr:ATP-binding protein [Eggerthellaceae bacterium]